MSAADACDAAASTLSLRYPDVRIVRMPMSDGGEGLVQCVARAVDVVWVDAEVHDPLMNPIRARYAITTDGSTAFLEMALAAGLHLVPSHLRNPMLATTYGVGDLLLDAVRRGCQTVVMGIGGSATCDGGRGMVECLAPYLPLPVRLIVASDVTNPLYGSEGAAYVFAPQKGATPEQVVALDERLRLFAQETVASGYDDGTLSRHPGAGAAGGLGYALLAYLKAELRSGIDLMLDLVGFDSLLPDAVAVLTGEGKSDRQTLMGKVPMGILRRAKGVPVHLLSGAVEDQVLLEQAGFATVQSINQGDVRPLSVLMQRDVAMQNLRSQLSALSLI